MARTRDWAHSLARDLLAGLLGGAGAAVVLWAAYLTFRWLF